MRHLLANIATYTIAGLLVIGSILFGWVRSGQWILSTETDVLLQHEPSSEGRFDWRALGERGYIANCMTCHGKGGEGWDQYPPLDQASRLFDAPGGRDYIIDLHLYGLTSNRWRAPMPPMGHIPDVELAAIINHVLSTFGTSGVSDPAVLVMPKDVGARRGRRLRPAEVDQSRPEMEPTGR